MRGRAVVLFTVRRGTVSEEDGPSQTAAFDDWLYFNAAQYATEFETALSVSRPRVPWSRGSWRSETAAAHKALTALRQPDGRVHFAGDYTTDMSSWMQGAFESAREVASAIHARARARA